MFKSILAAAAASATMFSGAAIAGPYVNIEANSGFTGSDYETTDNSRNNWWVGILAFGEGWHNNHHAHQAQAFHGEKWWEVDVTGYIIRLMSGFGIISNVVNIKKR